MRVSANDATIFATYMLVNNTTCKIVDAEEGGSAEPSPFHAKLVGDLGISLAGAIMTILHGFDRYLVWHQSIRAEPETDDQAG
eukprot:193760-Pleurochrysis_carterae.AAC.1